MTLQVVKRDNRVVQFSGEKLYTAINAAALATGYLTYEAHNIAEEIKSKVLGKMSKMEKIKVVDIHDLVEKALMMSRFKDAGRKYIEYRHDRDIARDGGSVVFKDIDDFLNGDNEEVNKENVNKSAEQLVTHRDLVAGIVSKHRANLIIPEELTQLHDDGGLHLHDRDYFLSKGMHNCGVYDFKTMLAKGVKLGDVDISSPKSLRTAANVTCQIFSKIGGSSYGGQSMHEFDVVMAPYAERSRVKIKELQVKYDLPDEFVEESLRKEIYDACQTFIYQIQTVTSSNGQSAFSSISLSLSTDPTCKMIKEEYLKCHTEGIGAKKRSPIFPKVLYFVEDGVNLNKGDPNYEEFQLALVCSSKHMYPDFIMAPNNRKMTGDSKEVISPMG